MRQLRVILATLVLLLGGLTAAATPAYADDCGDTSAAWVDATLGSAWSGTAGSDSFTAALAPPVLGVQAAATVVVATSGVGSWSYAFGGLAWTSTAAGVWSYRFEVSAVSCDGAGKVTAAAGSRVDALFNAVGVSMSRTL
jgi:hypothetical protein